MERKSAKIFLSHFVKKPQILLFFFKISLLFLVTMASRTIQFKDSGSKGEENFHFMNFKSEKDGDNVRTEEYMESQLKFNNNSNDKSLHLSFRGRPMNGRKAELPDGYEISVLDKGKKNEIKAEKHGRPGLTYWNLDKLPSDADALPQFRQWLTINEALHGHVQID